MSGIGADLLEDCSMHVTVISWLNTVSWSRRWSGLCSV